MKILKIRFKSLDEVFSMAKSKSGLNEPDTIFYDSREHFNKSLSQQKVQVLSTIAEKKPTSISDLAGYVPEIERERMSKICNELEVEGYIKLSLSKRGAKVPELAFDYGVIYIEETSNAIFIKPVPIKSLMKIKSKTL